MIAANEVRAQLKHAFADEPSWGLEAHRELIGSMHAGIGFMEDAETSADSEMRGRLLDQAIEEFRSALRSDPHLAPAHALLATCLGDRAGLERDLERRRQFVREQIDAYQHVLRIAPGDVTLLMAIGLALEEAAKLEPDPAAAARLRGEQVKAYRQAVHVDPSNGLARTVLAANLASEGSTSEDDLDALKLLVESVECARKAAELAPEQSTAWTTLAGALLSLHHRAPSRRVLEQALRAANEGVERGGWVYNRACTHALLGRRDMAFQDLQIALTRREVTPDHVRRDHDWIQYRADPRFEAILAGSTPPAEPSARDELIAFLSRRTSEQNDTWSKTNENWVRSLQELIGKLEGWLAPAVERGAFAPIQRLEVEVHEGDEGRPPYRAPALRIVTRDGVGVAVVPFSRRVVAATGRVDLIREPSGPRRLIVRYAETPPDWHVVTRNEEYGWKDEPLDEDAFFRALKALLE